MEGKSQQFPCSGTRRAKENNSFGTTTNSPAAVNSGLSDLQNHDGYRGDAIVGEFGTTKLPNNGIPSVSIVFLEVTQTESHRCWWVCSTTRPSFGTRQFRVWKWRCPAFYDYVQSASIETAKRNCYSGVKLVSVWLLFHKLVKHMYWKDLCVQTLFITFFQSCLLLRVLLLLLPISSSLGYPGIVEL